SLNMVLEPTRIRREESGECWMTLLMSPLCRGLAAAAAGAAGAAAPALAECVPAFGWKAVCSRPLRAPLPVLPVLVPLARVSGLPGLVTLPLSAVATS